MWFQRIPRPLRLPLFLVVFLPLLPLFMIAALIYWAIEAARHEFPDV
jgi:hypothetical protein